MILVIGDAIVDFYRELETVRESEGMPVVREVRTWKQAGGASAVAAMVESLGETCTLIGNDVCGVPRSTKTRTLLDSKPMFRKDVDVTTGFQADVVSLIRQTRIEPDFVLVTSYGKGAIDRSVVNECLKRGWKVIADPHITDPPEAYVGVYGITPNRLEDDRGKYWMQEGRFPRCCLKLDADGMRVRDEKGQPSHFESIARNPFDTCGCGDQVLATIGVMLSRGYDWHEACRVANIAAGLKCTKRGTTPVTRDELEQAMERNV